MSNEKNLSIAEGALYRKLRKNRGFSLKQVSDSLNSASFISKFEKGESNISFYRLERLLQNINVSIEEYVYLRDLDKNSTLNEDIKILDGYLSSDFYYFLAKSYNINEQSSQIGYEKAIQLMIELKEDIKPIISWQVFLNIYCDILILSYRSNLEKIKQPIYIEEINNSSKPIISYLYQVDDWGLFEIVLFRMFLFTFKAEQINQLLKLAISRTQKENGLSVMAYYRIAIIFSSFSFFANARHKKWAKDCLDMARKLLKDERDLTNSTLLLFYDGWYQYIFEKEEQGTETCFQAISILKILEQPILEKNYQNYFNLIKKNKKHPNDYLMYM